MKWEGWSGKRFDPASKSFKNARGRFKNVYKARGTLGWPGVKDDKINVYVGSQKLFTKGLFPEGSTQAYNPQNPEWQR